MSHLEQMVSLQKIVYMQTDLFGSKHNFQNPLFNKNHDNTIVLTANSILQLKREASAGLSRVEGALPRMVAIASLLSLQ